MTEAQDSRDGVARAAPCCGRLLDAATSVDHDERPGEGDISICAYCAAWLVFDESAPRMMTQEEIEGVPSGTRRTLERAERLIEEYHQRMARR